jgi:hypothetical protein
MVRVLIVIGALLAAIMIVAIWNSPAQSRGFTVPIMLKCNDTRTVLGMLHEGYKELPIGGGMSSDEQVRLFTSHHAGDKQTWTLIISNPNGLSCILKGGDDWIVAPLITKGDPT